MALSTTLCACGCGQFTRIVTHTGGGYKKGEARRYVHGHHTAGKPAHPRMIAKLTINNAARSAAARLTTNKTPRTSRELARKYLPMGPCEWAHIGHCMGKVDCAHMDGNPLNNDIANLKNLCHCHHSLYDRGRIDSSDPKMPPYFVSSGKRRYPKVPMHTRTSSNIHMSR